MVTWANHHYHDFVRNWVRNVEMWHDTTWSAMTTSLEKLIDDEVPTFAMQSGSDEGLWLGHRELPQDGRID